MWSRRVAFALGGTPCIRQRFVPKYIIKHEPVRLTQTRNAAFMVPIVKGFGRIGAILIGRRIRQWWAALPRPQKEAYWKTLRRWKGTFYAIGGAVGLGGLTYYLSHLEPVPITGRQRFIMFSENDLHKSILEENSAYLSMYTEFMLPTDAVEYKFVKQITRQLLSTRATERMESTHWKLYLVDSDVANAFVLPTGEIYMFTGMLKLLQDRDEVAIILAHEIAHALLQHGLERVSQQGLLEVFSLAFITAIWAALQSDFLAFLAHQAHNRLMSLFFSLPHSRKVELEADEVGLTLAAKACFDPRAGPRLWARLQRLQEAAAEGSEEALPPPPEYLSTHPGHGRRSAHLEALLPGAFAVAHHSDCTFLSHDAWQFRKTFKLI